MDNQFHNSSSECIDTALGLQLAGNKPDLAKSLLEMFVEELPEVKDSILAVYSHGDTEELYTKVHKLHGGCAYCGVPRLKTAASSLEAALKEGAQEPAVIEALLKSLVSEIDQVLVHYEQSFA